MDRALLDGLAIGGFAVILGWGFGWVIHVVMDLVG